jgi:hypothetical protein
VIGPTFVTDGERSSHLARLIIVTGDGNVVFSGCFWRSPGDGSGEYCVNLSTATIALEFSAGFPCEFSNESKGGVFGRLPRSDRNGECGDSM